MPLDFPASPSVNDTYTFSGRTWKWNGSGWQLTSEGVVGTTNIANDAVTSAKIADGTIVDGDISASAAIADTKLATISTAGKVSNSATTATSANTASAIVARDASGNFTAGTITAALTGNASTATTLQTARTINGTSFNGSANITVTANTTNSLTFNNGGAGGASGSTFNGGSALTVSYNSVGAPSTTGTNASGTWGISISGNAATVTNGVYTSGDQTVAGNKTFSGTTTLGNVASGFTVTAQSAGAGEGGEFSLAKPSTGSLAGNVILDINTNSLRIFENGGSFRGASLDITGCGSQSALLHSNNYNSYAPTLTGTGASGTWGINVTGSAGSVAASGITGQTGMWTSTARPGPYRLYRNDSNDAYNIQTTWSADKANYWSLRGYLNDTYHAPCYVEYSGLTDNRTRTFNSNWNTDFQDAPAGSSILRGDTSTGGSTGGPGGTWWFQQNMRHNNGTNFWGVQVAWGWEDNANRLRTRNVTGGTYGSWIDYVNSNNVNTYAVGLSGDQTVGGLKTFSGSYLRCASNTGGIQFNGDTAAANALDDYEEGTWTPTIVNGGTFTLLGARYVKIGKMCHLSFYMSPIANIPSNGVTFEIGGLPFAPDATAQDFTGLNIAYAASANIGTWLPLVSDAASVIYFHRSDSSGAVITNATNATTLNGNALILSGWYYAA